MQDYLSSAETNGIKFTRKKENVIGINNNDE